jgi:hypothetical protein
MAGERDNDRSIPGLRRAHALITEALDLLDAYGGSQQAAVHLALALDELRETSAKDQPNPSRE